MGEIEQNVSKFENELKQKKAKLSGIVKKYNDLSKQKIEIENDISNLESFIAQLKIETNQLKVSYHAIIRYFERVLGFNIKEIENKILSQEIIDRQKIIGDGKYKNGKIILTICNNVVVTIVKE